MQCQALRRNCKGCDARYSRHERVEKCTKCGADMRCGNDAIVGYSYCRHHGGPQPRYNFYGVGMAPVTGAGSKMPLVKLASRYTTLSRDGKFLSNRHSMELIWRRVEILVERIENNEAPDRLAKLTKLWNEFRDADATGKRVDAVALKTQLDNEFERAYHDYASWEQLFQAVDLYRKMTESEVKIAKDLKAIMTAEDGIELVSQLLAIVIQVVNDPVQLKRIIYEFRKLVGESGDDLEETATSWARGRSGEVIDP